MAFKFIAVCALISLAAVSAAPYYAHGGGQGGGDGGDGGHGGGDEGGHGGSSHQSVHLVSHGGDDHGHGHGGDGGDGGHGDDGHAEYSFDYGVKDKKTGDIKGHSETRHGHKVTGHYELIDSDGHKRTVHYTADKHSGFHAVVSREPTHHTVPGGHGVFVGGDAHVEQSGGDHHGHGGHGHHGHSSSFSIKQDHAAHHEGHGHH